jgi:hypothetical protein
MKLQTLLSGGLLAALFSVGVQGEQLKEHERQEEYERRGHVWPPKDEDYTPNTPGWRKLNQRRFEQLTHIEDTGYSYDGYMVTVHSALNSQNFTENGWGLAKAPQHIIDLLKESLYTGLEKAKTDPEYEVETKVIDGVKRPFWIRQEALNTKILHDLLPLHEAWSGVKLVPNNAYGLRVYREGSNLNMHSDKTTTHIISSILHVGHSEDMESWPIVIEDFQGNTNEVHLEEGDMLFYESSKCVHGRPRRMKGKDSWYSSLFIHYYPEDWDGHKATMDAHYRIPSIWSEHVPREEGDVEDLIVVESSVKEPACEHTWCALHGSKHWWGPAPGYGKVLSANGVQDLKDIPSEESFESSEKSSEDEL